MSETLKFGGGIWATKKGSTLAYNDENGNFKPLPFTFDRAGSATRVNKQGLIEVVSNNEPRIDFLNDSKGALLLEPSRSNIFDYSSDLSAWSKLNSTVSESSVLSLDGVNNSYGYERTSSSSSYIYRTVSLANTTQYTLSFFVKSGTSTNVRTDIWDTTQSTQCQIQVDLETKAISNFTGTSYKIEDYTNGWMRISVVFTSESSFGTTFNRYFNADSVGSELYIWGAQLEQGSYATSYIPTQGSIGTRVQDACYNDNLGNIIGQTEGTFYIETVPLSSTTSFTERIMQFESSGSNLMTFQRYANSNLTFFGTDGSNNWTIQGLNLFLGGETIKIAGAYKDNDIALYVNGVQIGTNTSANAPQVDRMWFANNASGSLAYSGSHKEVKFYNTRLSNTELQALTTI